MDLSKYLPIFLNDSQEHLRRMDEHLIQLERRPDDARVIDDLFRSAHSIKGMSTTMGFESLSQIAHSLESVLDPYRSAGRPVDRQAIDVLLQGVARLRTLITQVGVQGDGGN
jgi:two-component system chemotaxis sensor kinase CheA